jgi:anti-sigma-K factor RskA
MKWYQHPSVIDRLAASYVLGTLQGGARRRFESVMYSQPAVAAAVASWTEQMSPLLTTLTSIAPSQALWTSISSKAGIEQPIAVPKASWWQQWLAPIFAPLPAGALALGVALGVVTPALWQAQTLSQRQAVLPESYVGVLATPEGKTGLTISSLRQGKIVELQQTKVVTLPAEKILYLWRIDKAGQVTPVAAIPNEKWGGITLAEPAEAVFFSAVELAVSMEPAGSTPTQPSQAFIYLGLCGKFWKWM